MRKILAALTALAFLTATPVAAGVYVDIEYTGTATGYDGEGYWGTPGAYTNATFKVVYSFYEDEGPEQDYSLGAVFTLNGVDYSFEGSSSSQDLIAFDAIRANQLNPQRCLCNGYLTGYRQVYLSTALWSDQPDTRIEDFAASGSAAAFGNRLSIWGYEYGTGPDAGAISVNFKLNPTDIRVTTHAGELNQRCCKTTLNTTVPEPTTWALMILGFGSTGAMLRRRRTAGA
ncbi:MAG: PEP-CTERM sorting domain-containing protein [Phenylobacterium sp.]|uniref:PEPxxWA-CTERM sorting domain-containing protein n=1 Tax=Phenylobacterium sp. TaxID=1871053 RepID=UPI00122A5E26|nr:PEPxxWA-CTERM sorting domain-containing protein [Phenylobacterium sp.]TAJ69743.1 MAG: PEP-CTERM sorting domain-containing protein [Phenylobacterium sp.]